MRVWKKSHRLILLFVLFSLVAGMSIAAMEEDGSQTVYSALEKAFYLSSDQAVWVRPGLHVKILSTTIGADRKPVVTFQLTDDYGQGLDKDGKVTPGAVGLGIILAYIPQGQTQYVDYTTRPQTSPTTGKTENQASTDSGGVFSSRGDGWYDYRFNTVLPQNYDQTVTHTLGIYASRDLSEFGLSRYVDNQIFNFVPNGSPVTTVRDVAITASCNNCHDPLMAHGETGRQNMEICVLCHTPQSVDPDTGTTVDMPVMTHKIHMGENLPSVKAGTPYVIVGRGGPADFSNVAFPQDIRNCQTCHNGPKGSKTQPAQMNAWFLNPTRAACGACHDDIDWTSGKNHVGGPALSDKFCANCHYPQGEFEYDASIINAHIPPYKSAQLRYPKIQILSVTNTGPGQKPTIKFKITDKNNTPIDPTKMPRLSFNLAGPNTDYRTQLTDRGATTGAAFNSGDGTSTYNLAIAIPADATGSWSLEAEGYLTATLNPKPHAATSASQRDAMDNVVVAIPVTDKTAKARVTTADTARCNTCHEKLQLHGGNRNTVEACVICHKPTLYDAAAKESIDLKWMVHKIHTGEELTTTYTIGTANFNEVLYPGDRRDCLQCHKAGGFTVPVPAGRTAVDTPTNYWTPTYPTATACLACHDSLEAAAHAIINTANIGESCAVCHKETADFAASKVHAR